MRKFVTALVVLALLIGPVPGIQVAHFGIGTSSAEAGIFKKLGAHLVAGLIMRAAVKGLTAGAKRKIASYIAKHSTDRQFGEAVIKHLASFRKNLTIRWSMMSLGMLRA